MGRSLAWDGGTEMADHEAISQATGGSVFFCDAGSPGQPPTNETNGLLRRYFPKCTDLSVHTAQDLRPRATPGQQPSPEVTWKVDPCTGLRRAEDTRDP